MCHLRSSANTGCVQVANLKGFSAVTCVQNNSLACSLMFVMLASACICKHLRTCQDALFLACVYLSMYSMCEELKLSFLFNVSNFLSAHSFQSSPWYRNHFCRERYDWERVIKYSCVRLKLLGCLIVSFLRIFLDVAVVWALCWGLGLGGLGLGLVL